VASDIRVTPTPAEARRLALAHNVVPVTHSFISDCETPVSAFLKLGAPPRSFILESAEQGQRLGRYSFVGVGARALVTYAAGQLRIEEDGHVSERAADDPFAAIADLVASYHLPPGLGLPPLAGGAVGYFGYDLVRRLEHLAAAPPDDVDVPEMAFLLADAVLVFDHLKHTLTIVVNAFVSGSGIDTAYERAVARIGELKAALARPLPAREPAFSRAAGLQLTSNTDPRAYRAGVATIREHIYAGDAFQVVLSQRFSTPVSASALDIYRGLRVVNPSPYMFYIAFDGFALAGSSPEPLVKVTGRHAETRPIAGTRRRGADEAEDRRLMAELLSDEKERAEHIMLVDLGRNDLGRTCVPGSVVVDELMGVELYSHVMHLVSRVSGTVADGLGAIDVLKAAFPAGTVSGAPKVRAMQIIDELEPTRRGPYAGAIGYLSYSGDLDTCICIRTVLVKDGVAYMQAGAGIVADSVPQTELDETRNKAAALLEAVKLAHEEIWQ
jgi:anthranilate synthase component 1